MLFEFGDRLYDLLRSPNSKLRLTKWAETMIIPLTKKSCPSTECEKATVTVLEQAELLCTDWVT